MNLKASRAAALLALLCPLAAAASRPAEVEIYDRSSGQVLPVYWHGGERHVAGEPGHEYEIRICNRGDRRVLAVTAIDGINVITGATAAPGQGGYVVDPHGRIEIDGWRKSLDQVAAFYFTALPDSYAARTGRPDNVGVIGVALFRERQYLPTVRQEMDAAAPSAARKSAAAAGGLARDGSRLGTGHGPRRDSAAIYTRFERASDQTDEVIRIYYDSRRNLMARGVIPRPDYHMAERLPDPFPRGFVPDP